MGWMTPVDIYCERMSAVFWAEPLNAVSNLAFILAAWWGWREAGRAGRTDGLTRTLCLLVLAVGIGSFLFHTFAQRWAGVADVVPILLFIVLYLLASMNRLFGLRWLLAGVVGFGAFGVAVMAADAVTGFAGLPLNGSEGYVPALMLLAGCAAALGIMGHTAAKGIAVAAAVFAVSLTARTLDQTVCADLPTGTHFVWHLLNGAMIAVLLTTLVRHGQRGASSALP